MIAEKTMRRVIGAVVASVALLVVMTPIYLAQTTPAAPAQAATPATTPAPPTTTVYTNPRAGKDDPRVGLKPGLYDAQEVVFGLEHVATLPKPPGFSPENNATAVTANLGRGAFGGSGGLAEAEGADGVHPVRAHPPFR